MPAPKTLRILNAVAERLAVISQARGYYSDVGCDIRLDRREPNLEDLPCAQVFLSEGSIEDEQNRRHLVGQSLTVIVYDLANGRETEVVGWQLVADIQSAIEGEDVTLEGLLIGRRDSLAPESFEIILPESGVNAVAARITYAVPHIRKWGDPESL